MPDMREEFEAWATKHRMPIHRDGVVTDYAARCTDECWQAWQASRAALRVELPPELNAGDLFEDTPIYNASMIKVILQQAGIEVK
ncbi:hypothetical protein [Pseudomonas phage PAJU2]|uniref:hypothetical protein n=1 Tax=Pseudomonas phage PAJU2 TaxID=504346 RepID=UPI000181F381|nr:hypothetical protein PAJU2_gp39 [Pseudomonas phage PAJU2]BAG75023.1 hypothetical protein [Pseudomonas phage PAJU2]